LIGYQQRRLLKEFIFTYCGNMSYPLSRRWHPMRVAFRYLAYFTLKCAKKLIKIFKTGCGRDGMFFVGNICPICFDVEG